MIAGVVGVLLIIAGVSVVLGVAIGWCFLRPDKERNPFDDPFS